MKATNNFAEYTAIHKALEAAKSLGAGQITVYSDSELLVRQINGQYKVKSEQIRPLFAQAVAMLAEFENWQVRHVFREDNKQADELVNRALDVKRDVEMKVDRGKKVKPVRLGVLISGGGTTLINLVECIKQGKLDAEVAVVISSRSTVAGVERAKAAGLDVKIIRTKDHPDIDEFSKAIERELVAAKVDLVVQGGWLCLWKIPTQFREQGNEYTSGAFAEFRRAGNVGTSRSRGGFESGVQSQRLHRAFLHQRIRQRACYRPAVLPRER